MNVTVKVSAIQDELTVYAENTVTSGSEEKTFTLDISTFSTKGFQCKIEGKGNGKINCIASGIVEAKDNIPFGLSSYNIYSGDYEEIASWHLQKFLDDYDTLKIIVTMESNPIVIPTVTTQAVSSVEEIYCRGNGNIINTGGENCTRRGFCYIAGTTGDPTIADSVVYSDGSFGIGAYYLAITGLSETSYRIRAYAVNSAGVGYGETVLYLFIPCTKDNWLGQEYPNDNHGISTSLALSDKNYGGAKNTRSILEFDLSELHDIGATITSAKFRLFYYGGGLSEAFGKTAWTYKLTRLDWIEIQATWNIYKTGSNWTTAGGDYVTTNPVGGSTIFPDIIPLPTEGGKWMEWNVLDIVQDAYGGGNFVEFLIRFETENLSSNFSIVFFYSKEYSNHIKRPKLIIEYTT